MAQAYENNTMVGTVRTGRRRLLRYALVGCSALLVAACGGGSAGSSSSGGFNGSVTVGVIGPLTGTYAVAGQAMEYGSQAAQKAINDAGGINGMKLQLSLGDTVGDPTDAITVLRKMTGIDHVAALNGPTSIEIFALQQIIDRAHLVCMINGGTTALDTNTDKWVYRANASDSQLGVAMALYATQKNYKTAAFIFTQANPSEQELEAVVKASFQKQGGTVVADERLASGQTSYRSEVQAVVSAHPDVIFTQTDPVTAGAFFRDLEGLNGLTIPMIGSDITTGSDYSSAVGSANDMKVMTHVEAAAGGTDASANTTFASLYAAVKGGEPLSGANFAYDGLVVEALAMDAAHSIDPSVWVNYIKQVANGPGQVVTSYADGLAALKSGKKINYDGASGPMDYNQYNNVFGPFTAVQLQSDGSYKTVATLSATDLAAATK